MRVDDVAGTFARPCMMGATERDTTLVMRSLGRGLTLVHFSPQPEPFLSHKSPSTPHKKCSRDSEKWTDEHEGAHTRPLLNNLSGSCR
jgi:hypothetical protein